MKLIHKFTEENLIILIDLIKEQINYLESGNNIFNDKFTAEKLMKLKRLLNQLDC
jgi:hypothetical protein